MNVDGSRAKVLSGSLDRDAAHPQWSSESRTVYFIADDRGATHVYAARNDGTVRQVTSATERLRGFSLADNGRAVSIRSAADAVDDVFTFTVDIVTQPVTVAEPNRQLLAGRDRGAVEELTYPSAGSTVQAWLVKPPAFAPARKYPLLVDIADDPRRMYGPEFNPRAQILAAAGFVVLCANPRGTPGYGEGFGNLLRSRYPGDDFDDLMRGVDAAIARGFIDPERVHVAGGLLAAWAVGHTDRFRSAVARRPIVDWTTDVALSSDGPGRAAEWMGAMPWEDPGQYVQHSPIYSAGNFKTPVLILAAEHDPESDEFAFALRQRHVEAAVARIPADPILELQAILAWLTQR
jgi:acylaminoacyl-peptidase